MQQESRVVYMFVYTKKSMADQVTKVSRTPEPRSSDNYGRKEHIRRCVSLRKLTRRQYKSKSFWLIIIKRFWCSKKKQIPQVNNRKAASKTRSASSKDKQCSPNNAQNSIPLEVTLKVLNKLQKSI